MEPPLKPFGHSPLGTFHQPSFEHALLEGLARFETVRTAFAHAVTDLGQDADGVTLSVATLNGERRLGFGDSSTPPRDVASHMLTCQRRRLLLPRAVARTFDLVGIRGRRSIHSLRPKSRHLRSGTSPDELISIPA
jgi:hypothetical protein